MLWSGDTRMNLYFLGHWSHHFFWARQADVEISKNKWTGNKQIGFLKLLHASSVNSIPKPILMEKNFIREGWLITRKIPKIINQVRDNFVPVYSSDKCSLPSRSHLWHDGGIGRYALLPHTTKRRTTNLKTKNNQNCQKIELYGSPTPRS